VYVEVADADMRAASGELRADGPPDPTAGTGDGHDRSLGLDGRRLHRGASGGGFESEIGE
jgi:hypothetical protein